MKILMTCAAIAVLTSTAHAQSRYEHYQSICNKIHSWSKMTDKRKQFELEKFNLEAERRRARVCAKLTKSEKESIGAYYCIGNYLKSTFRESALSSWSAEDCVDALQAFNNKEIANTSVDSYGTMHTLRMTCDHFGTGICKVKQTVTE